jgi:single-strand DNA-binding protein
MPRKTPAKSVRRSTQTPASHPSNDAPDEPPVDAPGETPVDAGYEAPTESSGETGETVEKAPGRSARSPVLDGDAADNTIELRGRVSSVPVERELPSGAAITTFRISVARARTPMTGGSRQSVDWVDCTAWSARARRSVAAWTVGDLVEVTGALRRRFFRIGTGPSTRVEVEVLSARRARPRPPAE